MAETQIKFRRGSHLDPSIFPNLPNFGDLVYDGSTIIPEMLMNDCQPWIQHSKNYLFVGNVCINPEWEGVTPIEVSGPWFEDDPDHSGEPEEWGKFINRVRLRYDTRYFSVVNGKLVVRLGNGLTLGANGIDVDFNNFGHYVATNVQRGEVKTSWDGLVSLASDTAGLTIDGLYAGKSTGRSNLGETALYPTISEAGSWLWSYKYAPNNLFETISGNNTNGRLYTVIRPASSNLAGCIKVSKPLGRIDPLSTDQFPGPNSSYKWLSDSTSDASGCESSTTYLARLTNRYDLKANHGVDIDSLMISNPYDPTYITPQLNPERRDTLFETFVPLPIPTYVHPGIAKLSYNGFVFSGAPTFTPDSTLKTYPIGINDANQLVTVGPRKLSDLTNDLTLNSLSNVSAGNPSSGDILMYSGSNWVNTSVSRTRTYTKEDPSVLSPSDEPTTIRIEGNNHFKHFSVEDGALTEGIRIVFADYGLGDNYIIFDGSNLAADISFTIRSVYFGPADDDRAELYFGNGFSYQNADMCTIPHGKVLLLKMNGSVVPSRAKHNLTVFISSEIFRTI